MKMAECGKTIGWKRRHVIRLDCRLECCLILANAPKMSFLHYFKQSRERQVMNMDQIAGKLTPLMRHIVIKASSNCMYMIQSQNSSLRRPDDVPLL